MEILLYVLPILVIFYFLMIRPQRKQKNEKIIMLKNIKIGDEVITYSGIHGKVSKNPEDKDSFTMEIAKGVELVVEKEAIFKNVSQVERNKIEADKIKAEKEAAKANKNKK
ncbi:MAG: preprotein translocase subunit YajC [Fusobacteria bacterium]|nr:preprotein translocase subunit YajC [Fusobacteriota bacterium]